METASNGTDRVNPQQLLVLELSENRVSALHGTGRFCSKTAFPPQQQQRAVTDEPISGLEARSARQVYQNGIEEK